MRVEEEFGLKPCPFCGKEAVLHAETIKRAANGMIPITIMGIDIYETIGRALDGLDGFCAWGKRRDE